MQLSTFKKHKNECIIEDNMQVGGKGWNNTLGITICKDNYNLGMWELGYFRLGISQERLEVEFEKFFRTSSVWKDFHTKSSNDCGSSMEFIERR